MFCSLHSQLTRILNDIVEHESGVKILNNIVDNIEQCVGCTTLFNLVFINFEQATIFGLVG